VVVIEDSRVGGDGVDGDFEEDDVGGGGV